MRHFFGCFQKIKEPPDISSKPKPKCEPIRMRSKHISQPVYAKRVERVERRNNYRNLKFLSSGYYAKVYRAQNQDNDIVAIKRIKKDYFPIIQRECKLLYKLESDHIIKIIDVFENNNYFYLVLPYYKSDLFDYIPKLLGKPNKIFKILLGIAKGLSYMHSVGYMHGDIKLENIMLTECEEPIIIDLGLAKKISNPDNAKRITGTLTYLPPEVIEHQHYSDKMDIWALGVMMYIMMFDIEPFRRGNIDNRDEIFQMIKYKDQYYPNQWKLSRHRDNRYIIYKNNYGYIKMVNLNKMMLKKEYNQRLSINNIIEELENILKLFEMDKSKSSLKLSHFLMIQHLKRWRTV